MNAATATSMSRIAAVGRSLRIGALWLADQLPEALIFGGAVAITYGVALRFGQGTAWIVGGLLALATGWRLGRPQPDSRPGGPRG